jgi:hypothetical protein
MKTRDVLWGICLALSAAALAAGLVLAGRGLLAALAVLPAAGWTAARLMRREWPAGAALAASLALAAAGLLLGAPFLPLLACAALAMAAWDLTLFGLAAAEFDPASAPRLERAHFATLLPALGLGLALSLGAYLLPLRLPFALLLAAAGAALFALAALRK